MVKRNNSQFLGTYKQQLQYKSYLPPQINSSFNWQNIQIAALLEEATWHLSKLNAYSTLVPDVNYFVKMHVVKESTSSSRIEGTRTNISQVLMEKEELEPELRDDWQEVQNYIQAMNFALEELKHLPLSMRLLKNTHRVLLQGVRGKHKLPGEIRKSQNWIGGSSLKDAFYIPPHHEDLPDLLTDLEKFWHNQALDIPTLIKIAVSHYQFETIHPFLDGNGRIGRLLIVLQLMSEEYLEQPTLYISEFFEKHRTAYYDALNQVRASGQIDQWLKFFLSAVIDTSQKGADVLQQLVTLQAMYEQKLTNLNKRADKALLLLKAMYAQPRMKVKDMANLLDTSYVTANQLVKDLEQMGILQEITGYSRNRTYILHEYLQLFTDEQV